MTKRFPLLVGAHMSAAGGPQNAILRAEKIGATTVQLFTSNQKQWKGKKITEEELLSWKSAKEKTGIEKTISHDSYLINLGSYKEDILEKSRKSFGEEIARCQLLEITYLNFHPGVATEKDTEKCLDKIVENLLFFRDVLENSSTRLLLETTAGQGNSVGHCFSHLRYIIDRVKDAIPIGVCLDTCHIFAAGYDLASPSAVEKTLGEFASIIGMHHLYAVHLNDSKKPLGSKRDRHASLGKGEIGLPGIEAFVSHKDIRSLPLILETPDPSLYEQEINLVRKYAKNCY